MNELYQPAFVRVSGPPNSNFLVGYPGISATLVRLFTVLSASAYFLDPRGLGPDKMRALTVPLVTTNGVRDGAIHADMFLFLVA